MVSRHLPVPLPPPRPANGVPRNRSSAWVGKSSVSNLNHGTTTENNTKISVIAHNLRSARHEDIYRHTCTYQPNGQHREPEKRLPRGPDEMHEYIKDAAIVYYIIKMPALDSPDVPISSSSSPFQSPSFSRLKLQSIFIEPL